MHVDDERRLACADKLFARRRIVESVYGAAIERQTLTRSGAAIAGPARAIRCRIVSTRVPG